MDYYNMPDDQKKRMNLDYDFCACLRENPQTFNLIDVERVMAVWPGENDGDDWRWIVKLTQESGKRLGGRFVFLQGGCDYTGWDCQSWAKSSFANTALKACEFAKTGPEGATVQDAVTSVGVGRMLAAMSGEYMNNTDSVYDSLVEQVRKGKSKTWRDGKDAEFGL